MLEISVHIRENLRVYVLLYTHIYIYMHIYVYTRPGMYCTMFYHLRSYTFTLTNVNTHANIMLQRGCKVFPYSLSQPHLIHRLITFHTNPAAPTLVNGSAGRAVKATWRCAYGKRILRQPWRISRFQTRMNPLYPAIPLQLYIPYSIS